MSKAVARISGIVVVLLVAGGFGFSVLADDAGPMERFSRWLQRIHGHGAHGHGHGHHGGDFFHGVHHLLDDLELSAEQHRRVESIHETLIGGFHGTPEDHRGHLKALIERIETNTLDAQEAQQVLAQHLETIGRTLELALDETVALVSSLDDDQRALLVEHLEALASKIDHHR